MTNFDEEFERRNTNTWKWDGEGKGCQYPMGTADMDFRMPAVIYDAIIEKVNQGILSYAADKTFFGKAFAEYQKRRNNLDVRPEWVIPGTALMAVYKVILDSFTSPGDGVIVQTPVFGPLYSVVKNNGRIVYDNALVYDRNQGTWSIDFDQLATMCADPRVRMLVVCNPGNPTTKAFSKDEMQKMYDLAHEHNIVLVSDEIHSDIYYDGRKHCSALNVMNARGENVVVLTSSGKVFGIPGLKAAATVIANDELRDRFTVANTNAKMDVIDLGLMACKAGYEGADAYIDELNAYLQRNKDYIVDWFQNNDIQVRLTKPEASYLFWLDFCDWGLSCEELEALLKKYGIVFSSGTEFGGAHNEGFMRMNIATRYANIQGALAALKQCWQENIHNR